MKRYCEIIFRISSLLSSGLQSFEYNPIARNAGESNQGNAASYGCALTEMVRDWRNNWHDATGGSVNSLFPFGQVQVPYIDHMRRDWFGPPRCEFFNSSLRIRTMTLSPDSQTSAGTRRTNSDTRRTKKWRRSSLLAPWTCPISIRPMDREYDEFSFY